MGFQIFNLLDEKVTSRDRSCTEGTLSADGVQIASS